MFDVPPPARISGIDGYRQTWPQFFDWLKSGGTFEIVWLDVTAGEDVAYATALLRCGRIDGAYGVTLTRPKDRKSLSPLFSICSCPDPSGPPQVVRSR